MKKTIITLLAVVAISFQLSVLAQGPPPPNNGNGNPNGGNTPVGGGVPVAGGIFILLTLSALYAGKKYFQKKEEEIK